MEIGVESVLWLKVECGRDVVIMVWTWCGCGGVCDLSCFVDSSLMSICQCQKLTGSRHIEILIVVVVS